MIQVPVNIFDQRLVSSGILAKAKTKNIEVYARSVFLQGLLLMSYSNIPSWFRPFFGYFKPDCFCVALYPSNSSVFVSDKIPGPLRCFETFLTQFSFKYAMFCFSSKQQEVQSSKTR